MNNTKILVFLVLLLIGFSELSYSQEESFPCREANPALKSLFENGQIDRLYVHSCSGEGLHELTSSYLKASGTAPEIIEDPEGMNPPNDSEYVAWTCKYSPGNLQDGNPQTAWVEGKEGYGSEEVVLIPCLDLKKPVEIWNGYGKSEKLYALNSRIKRVELAIIQSERGGASQYGSYYLNLKAIAKSSIELLDKNGFQEIDLPEFEQNGNYHYFLAIRIVDVYPGTKWKDTCISEIRNAQ